MDNNLNSFQNPSLSGINDGVESTSESVSVLNEINKKIGVVEEINGKLDEIIGLIKEQVKKTDEIKETKVSTAETPETPKIESNTIEMPEDLIKEDVEINTPAENQVEPVQETKDVEITPTIDLNGINLPEENLQESTEEKTPEAIINNNEPTVNLEVEPKVEGEAIDSNIPQEPETVDSIPETNAVSEEPSDFMSMDSLLQNVEASAPAAQEETSELEIKPDVKIDNGAVEEPSSTQELIAPDVNITPTPVPQAAPVQTPVEPAPVQAAPTQVEVNPVQTAPTQTQVEQPAPVQPVPTPVEASLAQAASVEPQVEQTVPVQAPVEPAPVEAVSSKPYVDVLNINIPSEVKTESGKQRSDVRTDVEQANLTNYNTKANVNAQTMVLTNAA